MTRTDYNWPVLIGAYFIIQTLSRTLFGGGLGLDEAEMLLTAQSLEWGYGPQPPLYSWLQFAVIALFGESIFSLALMKNAFLCLTYLGLYFLLRSEYDKRSAGLASVALLLLPQIAWESQRALSHSVLSTMMVVLTFAVFVRLNRKPDTGAYLLFGICIACGTLSKFNFILLPVAILAAALSLPETRKRVITPRLLISLGVCAAILFMPVSWIVKQPARAFSSLHKFQIEQDISRFKAAAIGSFDLATAAIAFLALLIVVLGLLFFFYRTNDQHHNDKTLLLKLMIRTVIAALLLTLVVVLATGTTNVKDRWLQPVLIFAAPAAVLWLLPKLDPRAGTRFFQVICAAAILVILAIPLNNYFGSLKKPSRRNAPFAPLAEAINKNYPHAEIIFAQTKWLGGNLRYLNKNWQVVTPGTLPEKLTGKIVCVWQSDNQQILSSMLNQLKGGNRTITATEPATSIKLPYPARPDKFFTASYAATQSR